jgi:hypothetical protein
MFGECLWPFRRVPIHSTLDLMTIFVGLTDHEFQTAPIEMWCEVFTAWSAAHGRADDESSEQLRAYEEFLRASIWHLKQLRDSPRDELSDRRRAVHAETILTGLFAHVARLIAFAERKVAGGKMPRRKESAVLGRAELVRLLDDDTALLDEAIKRERAAHPGGE